MLKENVNKLLKTFGRDVIRESKKNLIRQKKNVSKRGYKSLAFTTEKYDTHIDSAFYMEDYMYYQDQGVSGKERKFNTPFSYKDKRPPASAFSSWSVRRGIAPRSEDGRFIPRRSLQFALATHIYKKGIEPSLFFTVPFEKWYKKLVNDLDKAYGEDIEIMIKEEL